MHYCFYQALLSSSFSFAHSEQKITHLLGSVGKMECNYQRNGSDHNGEDARSHIQKNMIIILMILKQWKTLLLTRNEKYHEW